MCAAFYFYPATCRGPRGHGSDSANAGTSVACTLQIFADSSSRSAFICATAGFSYSRAASQSPSLLPPKDKLKGKTNKRQSVRPVLGPATPRSPRSPTRARKHFHHLILIRCGHSEACHPAAVEYPTARVGGVTSPLLPFGPRASSGKH